jgi:hypothetical protein
MKIEELKKRISEIEGQFHTETSKELREIIFIEAKLLENEIIVEFKRDLSHFTDKNPVLGKHQFRLSDYQLAWEKGENDIFNLSLTNKVLGKKIPLKKCPKNFFPEILGLMPLFLEELNREVLKEN